jgi:hypothetical protein
VHKHPQPAIHTIRMMRAPERAPTVEATVWIPSMQDEGSSSLAEAFAPRPATDDGALPRLVAEWRAAAWRAADAWEIWRAASGRERLRAQELYVSAIAEEEVAAERLQREVKLHGQRSA